MLEFPVCFADAVFMAGLVQYLTLKPNPDWEALLFPVLSLTGEAPSVLSSYMASQHHDGKVAIHTPPDWKRYREYLNRIHF